MVEYNQCQAMLRNLYELGIPGKVEEFTAYRILMLLHGRNRSGTFTSTPSLWPVTPLAADKIVFILRRFEFVRRSTNSTTEIRSRRATCPWRPTCGGDGELPCPF